MELFLEVRQYLPFHSESNSPLSHINQVRKQLIPYLFRISTLELFLRFPVFAFLLRNNFCSFSHELHYAHRGFCRFRDDTAADIASSRTNAASPIARVTRSREARVTDLHDKTPRRAAFLSDQPSIERRSYQINAASRGVVVRT